MLFSVGVCSVFNENNLEFLSKGFEACPHSFRKTSNIMHLAALGEQTLSERDL